MVNHPKKNPRDPNGTHGAFSRKKGLRREAEIPLVIAMVLKGGPTPPV